MLSSEIIQNRQRIFLSAFRELRKRKPALMKAGMKYEQYSKWVNLYPDFSEEVEKIEEFLNSTIRCGSCGYVGVRSHFVNMNVGLTRSGRCKTCHSKKQILMRQTNLGHKFVKCLQDARLRSKRSGLSFELNVKVLRDLFEKQEGKCFYTGIPMTWHLDTGMAMVQKKEFSTMISVDRVNPHFGYTIDNIVICCFSVNLMKGGLSHSSFLDFCGRVVDHAKKS